MIDQPADNGANTPPDAPDDDPSNPCIRCNGTGTEPTNAPNGTPGAMEPGSNGANGRDAGTAHGKMGKPRCNRRRKVCSKCTHRFTKAEYELWECPNCGFDRHCLASPPIGSPPGSPCKYHGGMALPAGPNHPSWIHGRYSKVTPPYMTEIYEASRKDEKLLSVREEIALHDAMIVEFVSRLQKLGPSSKLWAELKENQKNLNAARAAKDTGTMAKLLQRQDGVIERGSAIGELWDDTMKTCQSKRKLTASESKMERDNRMVLSQERVTFILVSMATIVRNNVSNPTELRQIAFDFSLLLDDRTVDAANVTEPISDH